MHGLNSSLKTASWRDKLDVLQEEEFVFVAERPDEIKTGGLAGALGADCSTLPLTYHSPRSEPIQV
jgi:hypothetical protein